MQSESSCYSPSYLLHHPSYLFCTPMLIPHPPAPPRTPANQKNLDPSAAIDQSATPHLSVVVAAPPHVPAQRHLVRKKIARSATSPASSRKSRPRAQKTRYLQAQTPQRPFQSKRSPRNAFSTVIATKTRNGKSSPASNASWPRVSYAKTTPAKTLCYSHRVTLPWHSTDRISRFTRT